MNGKPNFNLPPDLSVVAHNCITTTNQAHMAALNAQGDFFTVNLHQEKEKNLKLQKRIEELEAEVAALKAVPKDVERPVEKASS